MGHEAGRLLLARCPSAGRWRFSPPRAHQWAIDDQVKIGSVHQEQGGRSCLPRRGRMVARAGRWIHRKRLPTSPGFGIGGIVYEGVMDNPVEGVVTAYEYDRRRAGSSSGMRTGLARRTRSTPWRRLLRLGCARRTVAGHLPKGYAPALSEVLDVPHLRPMHQPDQPQSASARCRSSDLEEIPAGRSISICVRL